MKIAFINCFTYPIAGGTEIHVQKIAEYLASRGHDVTCFSADINREGEKVKPYEVINKVKIKRLKTLFRLGDFGVVFPSIFKEIKKLNPDIINVHSYRHFFNFIPLLTKKPCVITPHWPNYPKGVRKNIILDWYVNIFDKVLGKFLLRKFKKVFAVSGLEIPWLVNLGVDKKNIELTPNGIEEGFFKKYKKTYKKKRLIALMLSRLHKSKGFDQVIKIASDFPEVDFVIAGVDAGFEKKLKKLAKGKTNVKFFGKASEKQRYELYSSADIFIHPSHYEAFGIVVVEAMAQNCAVLTSDSGGLPWVVDKAGLIFKDNNSKELKEKLSQLVKDKKLRENLVKLGKKRSEQFTWKRTAEKIEKIFLQNK